MASSPAEEGLRDAVEREQLVPVVSVRGQTCWARLT